MGADPDVAVGEGRSQPLVHERAFPLLPEELWELMWHPDLQSRWLGTASPLRLLPDHPFAFSVAGGSQVRGRVAAMPEGRRVELIVEHGAAPATALTVTVSVSSTGGALVRIDDPAPPDVAAARRFWTQVLNALTGLVAGACRHREDPRQAVVIIHGIGEQEPGRTLTAFVNSGAVAGRDQPRWVKPDRRSPLFELRRVTVQATPGQQMPTTHVFELYWAHVIRDTSIGQVLGWMRGLLLRPEPSAALVPFRWLVFGLLAIIAGASVVGSQWVAGVVSAASIAFGIVLKLAGRSLVVNHIGDAARYLSPKPANVAHRQSIREAGVELLEDLHESGQYDRIVLVGHSLGSVIAYDILTYTWIRLHQSHRNPRHPRFGPLRAVEREIRNGADGEAGRSAQAAAWRQIRRNTQPWLVTDLITLGSPLTHAVSLMARDAAEFDQMVRDRVLPTCPPLIDTDGRCTFDLAYPHWSRRSARTFTVLNHGAVFGATRWTNLYFRTKMFGLGGDPVGGPVRPVFGPWVCDVELTPPRGLLGFAHTRYWDPSLRTGADDPATAMPAHIRQLRTAMALAGGAELRALAHTIPPFVQIDRGTAEGLPPQRGPSHGANTYDVASRP